jgi:hypothetical protein
VRGYDSAAGGDYTLTLIESPRETPTPLPTPTIPPAGDAQIGDNESEIPVGGSEVWTFAGEAGQLLTFETLANWDTVMTIRRQNGELLAENDDSPLGGRVSLIEGVLLPSTEPYQIEVRSYNNESGGDYILRITDAQ